MTREGKIIAVASFVLVGALGVAQAREPAPVVPVSIHINAPIDTVPKYDSVYGFTATVKDTAGRQVSVPITWSIKNRAVAAVANGPNGTATLAGIQVGQTYLVAQYSTNPPRRTYFRDSLLVTTKLPHVAKVQPFFNFTRTTVAPFWSGSTSTVGDTSIHIGSRRCAYAVTWDRRGGIITGKHITFTVIQDSVVAVLTSYPTCPDTSINPLNLPFPTPQPPDSVPGSTGPPPGRVGRRVT